MLCQVPVDVASFLLNEKRSEIAKIEMKQRINVLLVPNKTLETPNYRLERLKHDDPRLDNIEASYKMAEEMEDATTVTRRSQEKHNRQEPIIKGVLPDAPAPAAVPKPIVVAPLVPRAAPPVAAPIPVPAPVAAPAEKGLLGWIKTLFAGPDEPAPTPPAPVLKEVKKDERPVDAPREGRFTEGRGERPERGGRDGRRGGGGRSRGEGAPEGRNEGRPGERRERKPEGRAEGARPERQERPPAEFRVENRNEGRAENGAEGQPRNESPVREGRGERNRPRGERPERGERADRGERVPRDAAEQDLALVNQAAMAAAASGSEAPLQRQDRAVVQDAGRDADRRPGGRDAEAGEGRRERGDRGGERNSRRNERRDERPTGNAEPVAGSQADSFDAAHPAVAAGLNGSGDLVAPVLVHNDQLRPEGREEGQERPPRRSRDRYGRERRERMDRSGQTADGGATPEKPEFSEPNQAFMQQERAPIATELVAFGAAAATEPARTVAAPRPAVAPVSPPAAAAGALPKVQSYDLPMNDLARVAESSGLQWINSDAAKIAEAKAAMAAEARPIVVPRERPAKVAVEQAPLVLVETRRDLGSMPLPFEKSAD